MITLITGGARSGKTRHALAGAGVAEPCTYIATAELLDDEMRERAARHQKERGHRWHTIEEPFEVGELVITLQGVVVVDCLTLWLSNWMLRDELQVDAQIDKLCSALQRSQCDLFAITNEVGSSIVPEYRLGRRFRDWSGLMNQRVAALADRVDLMVCGIPLRVK
jgi:adenosylcobinamide kinase/adenosylcobinamide-phosphate guanylyltransferase